MIPLERVLEILAPRLEADGEYAGTEVVVISAKRVGNKWHVTSNTLEFAETGDTLTALLGSVPYEVSDDGVVTGVPRPGDPIG
jgi:hypothetical protein